MGGKNLGVAPPEGNSKMVGFVRGIGIPKSRIRGVLQASGNTRRPSSSPLQGLVVCSSDLTISALPTVTMPSSDLHINICLLQKLIGDRTAEHKICLIGRLNVSRTA